MPKKILLSIFSLILAIGPLALWAEQDDTIAYLQNTTQNAWITQGLAAAGASNIDISYLDLHTSDLMTAAKNILALASVQSDNTESLNDLVAVVQNNFDGTQIGSPDLLNDDFWGLIALESAGVTSQTAAVKNFILAHQNSDYGWSWGVEGQSDTNDTAAAVMALLETDLTASSEPIAGALSYLASAQNADGGFGYDVNSESDGASTAWVMAALNKANQNNDSAVAFLQSLHQPDGSYLWLPGDQQGSVLVTAYALLALSDSAYPVHHIVLDSEDDQEETGISLRIEGPDNTICLAKNLEAETVLDLVAAGASVCDYTYETRETEWGVYVYSIGGVIPQGMDGWQYFVNWAPGTIGAGDYQLSSGDSVLWGYGGWPLYAGKITINNAQTQVTATYFNGNAWLSWAGAQIKVNDQVYTADNQGQANIVLDSDGIYTIYAEYSDQVIRSNKEYVTVGNGISQSVDLSVNIIVEGPGDPGDDDTIAFVVNQSSINFGDMNPGQSAETILTLSNTGALPLYVEANILGDNTFVDYTSLNQNNWQDYQDDLAVASSTPVNVNLSVPGNFSNYGLKSGQLIFWATSR